MAGQVGADFTLPVLEERVLSTLNADGTRRWVTPREVRGPIWRARLVVAWALIALFTTLPWLRISGKPPILLDVMLRQFTFFGTTFRPTETLLLALLMLTVFVTIFLATALFGRVWCGWACPQTVYLEFVYRPLERLLLGAAYGRRGAKAAGWRRLVMYAAFLVLSAHLANTFLAYFVGTDRLTGWILGSPAHHPVAFAVFAATVALMMFDFAFFREQLCTLVCPYGRFQSALLDRSSLIIAYDTARGEPRAGGAQRREMAELGERAGDCVACTMCVQVCPTAIDIRDGLQLECVNCAQCIDACNEVMDKVGKPRGLIRYSTQGRGEARRGGRFRVRIAVYALLLLGLTGALVTLIARRQPASVEQVRIPGANFSVAAEGVRTPVRIMIENYAEAACTFAIEGVDDVRVDPPASLTVPALDAASITVTVVTPQDSFGRGNRAGTLLVREAGGFSRLVPITIAGPFNADGAIGRGAGATGGSTDDRAARDRADTDRTAPAAPQGTSP
jgi:cytochrome c oxidase accessory protein FixG